MQKHVDISSSAEVMPATAQTAVDDSIDKQSQNNADVNLADNIFIQPKLSIGAVDDPMEHEADAVADKVMRMPETNFIQRNCAHCEEEEKETIQRKPLASFIQKKESSGGFAATDTISNQINSTKGNGSTMDAGTKNFMESRFETDLGGVKIHTGNEAIQMNRDLNAKAFTVGSDIYFNEGQYQPGSDHGKHLLAHELTHTVQQGPGIPSRIQRQAPAGSPAPPVTDGGLSPQMAQQIARRLRTAMKGPGTDEEAIYAAFAGRTNDQVAAISRVYQELFARNLMADIQDELNEDELKYLAIFSPGNASTTEGSTPADMVAIQLRKAINQSGTDETAIMGSLTGRTQTELVDIKEAYKKIAGGHTLEADLRDELSGADLTTALRLLNQGLLEPEDELYLAMEGLGTDEATLFRVLDSLAGNATAIDAMEKSYRAKYGDLIADLRGDLSGKEYSRAMKILEPVLADVAFEDCSLGSGIIAEVRSFIPTGIQKVEHAIAVLSKGLAGMSAAEMFQFKRFFDPDNTGDIDQRFISDVLGNYKLIRREFHNDLTVECETNSGICSGGRLYYTYWSNIHVCPYFTSESDPIRKARDFVHELAHNAMMAIDRPYYDVAAGKYEGPLTPRGPWYGQIPVIGQLLRFASHSDTLNHPDAYSWFAFEVP